MRIYGLRLVRSVGYSGGHPRAVALAAIVLVVLLDGALSEWSRRQLTDLVGPGYNSLGGLLAAVIVVAVFFIAGPVMLLTESIRGQGSSIQAVLSALPLTLREIGFVTWLPGFSAALVLLVLLIVPASSSFIGLGLGFLPSLEAAGACVLSGSGLAALVIVGIRLGMRGQRWASSQFPTMLLVWVGVCALESWQAGLVVQDPSLTVWQYLLLCPLVVDQVTRHPEALWVVLGISAAMSVGAVILLPWSVMASGAERVQSVLWTWNRRWYPPLATLELTRFLRSGEVLANLIGAEVIAVGLAIALVRMPVEFRSSLAAPLLVVISSVLAIPLVLLRGRTRAALPVPLLLGIAPIRWAAAQLLAGLVIFAGVMAGAVAVLLALGVSTGAVLTIGVPFGIAAAGLALAIGWLIPATPDNPLGQIGDTLLLLFVLSFVAIGADHWLITGAAMWTAAMILVGLVGGTVAMSAERRRWARRVVPISGREG